MKKKLAAIFSLVLAVTMSVTGCGGTSGGEKVARVVSGGEPGSLHPALSQGTHESIILDHVFEGLMKRDKEGKIVPGMAKDYKVSDDKLTYTFNLRDDAKWSNGDPVVAADFEYAWKYALNPNSASDYAYQLYYLEGGHEFNSADTKKTSEEDLKKLEDAVGVKATDEKTLVVKLKQPTAYFLELCAFYTYYPIDKKVQEENPDWAKDGSTFVCNGPFTVKEWNHDQDVVTVKNDNYYNKKEVKLSGVTFIISEDQNTEWQMYQNGETDVNFNLPQDVLGKLRADKDKELTTTPKLSTYYYRFNTTRKPFNNVKVRKALAMGVDRQLLIDQVAQGGQSPAYGTVPSGVADAKGDFRENGGDYFKSDLEGAKALLAEGLKEEGMDKLDLSILYNTSEGHKKIAEAIQQMWKKLGVNVTLENTEFKVKIDREHALDYDVSRSGWVGDYIDPNTFLDMYTSWSTQNDTGWTNPEYDKLIKDAAEEFDPAKRMQYLHDAEKTLIENMPIMPIYYYTDNIMQKSYLTGTLKVPNREICLVYADMNK